MSNYNKYTWNVKFPGRSHTGSLCPESTSFFIASSEPEAVRDVVAWYNLLYHTYLFNFSKEEVERHLPNVQDYKDLLRHCDPTVTSITLNCEQLQQHTQLVASLKGYQV